MTPAVLLIGAAVLVAIGAGPARADNHEGCFGRRGLELQHCIFDAFAADEGLRRVGDWFISPGNPPVAQAPAIAFTLPYAHDLDATRIDAPTLTIRCTDSGPVIGFLLVNMPIELAQVTWQLWGQEARSSPLALADGLLAFDVQSSRDLISLLLMFDEGAFTVTIDQVEHGALAYGLEGFDTVAPDILSRCGQ